MIPITAIVTMPGRGGISVVRVSGPGVRAAMHAVCGHPLASRQATYLPFFNTSGNVIDRDVTLWFPAPHSCIGENVLELQDHGGPAVMRPLLQHCLTAGREIGLRVTEPDEFTRRTFFNDKMDLMQVGAVADLAEASTEAAVCSAARSLDGTFPQTMYALVERMVYPCVLVGAALDFPEEEIDSLEVFDVYGQLTNTHTAVDGVLAQARQGALLHEGLHVVLIGQPNIGKSSLLNALAGTELAIVMPIAGTTRSRVQQTIQIGGTPLNIVDTAGLRDTEGKVERIGIERAQAAIAHADVVSHLLDTTDYRAKGSSPEDTVIDAYIVEHVSAGILTLRVINKIGPSGVVIPCCVDAEPPEVWLSARDGLGVELLRAMLLETAGWQGGGEGLYLARERHLAALCMACKHLATAVEHATQQAQSLDLLAEELRLAQETLSNITGVFSSDDLLGVIFDRFRIGK